MTQGYLALVLHAHLPFVRHPEDPTVMEERWLFEAVSGCYLPLVQILEGLERDAVPARLTLSLSPTLLSMLSDELLQSRCQSWLDSLVELAGREVVRTHHDRRLHRLAEMYDERFRSLRETWRKHDGNLVSAFAHLQRKGLLELLTATATHAFFPAFAGDRASIRAQIEVAADLYEQHFGTRTRGMWLGECAYAEGVDELLRQAGVRYFFVDGHALRRADSEAAYDIYAPAYCPSGVAAFARDNESSEQVWSSKVGYPGDPVYRDFYRDIGFDLPLETIGPWIHPNGHRMATGIKYHAITHARLDDKELYDPDAARARAGMHAAHFRDARTKQVRRLAAGAARPPLIVSPYDAELFGHWWFEGPVFLGDLFRQLHHDQTAIEPITPSGYLQRYPTNQILTPSESSWGEGGYSSYWVNEKTGWLYPPLHAASTRMRTLATRFRTATGPRVPALNQAARELLLAQASDWPFILQTGTTVPYATRRFTSHLARFHGLCDQVETDSVSLSQLAEVESIDNLFPRIDYRVFADAPSARV